MEYLGKTGYVYDYNGGQNGGQDGGQNSARAFRGFLFVLTEKNKLLYSQQLQRIP